MTPVCRTVSSRSASIWRSIDRRTGQGLSKKEIIRCLKRYVARKIFKILVSGPAPDTAQSTSAA